MRLQNSKLAILSISLLLLLVSLPASAQSKLNLSCQNLPDMMRAYLSRHVVHKKLDDTMKNRTVSQMIKMLDPSKMLFLKSEVDEVSKDLEKLFTSAAKNDCGPLERVHTRLVQKNEELTTIIKEFVTAKDYKLDENTELLLDSDKREFPKDKKEREDFIKKIVHFRISNYLAADQDMAESKRMLVHAFELSSKRMKEKKPKDYFDFWLNAFASALDPHSDYMSSETLEEFTIRMNLSLKGIGATLSSQDGFTVVEEMIAGGPAARDGRLKPKDKIIAVQQDGKDAVSVIDMDLKDVVQMIRGAENTKVVLTVLRKEGKSSHTLKIDIVRDVINIKEQAAKLEIVERTQADGKKLKLGVLDLPAFYGDTSSGKKPQCTIDFKAKLEEAKQKKVDGLVINLSRNGGGLLDAGVEISGFFIKQGGIVATKSSNGQVDVLNDPNNDVFFQEPIVVLISRQSASASEIFAGAIKDYKRGVIVGDDNTYGKGTVQAVIQLPPDLGAIKVTTGMFYRPSGVSTQHTGVVADVLIPSRFNLKEIGEGEIPYSLEPSKIPAFQSAAANDAKTPWAPIENKMIEELRKRSETRIAKSSQFKEIKKDLEELRKNRGSIKISELRKRADKENSESKKNEKKSSVEREKEAEAPQIGEALSVLEDLVLSQKGKPLPRL